MTWDDAEERVRPQMKMLSSYRGHGSGETYSNYEQILQHNDGTGLYTLPAVMSFLKFMIDISKQTTQFEFLMYPSCLVCISIDDLDKYATTDISKGADLLELLSRELARITRDHDRAGRYGRDFVVFLTRTTSEKVKSSYAPSIASHLAKVADEAGMPTRFSFGIAELIEHCARDTDDMCRKSVRALQAAQEKEPGTDVKDQVSIAVYNFDMSLDDIKQL